LSLLIGAAVAGGLFAVAGGLFACRIALLRHGRRKACLALIIQRGERLPLPCVERRRRSLLKRKALEGLASSIDDLVRAATQTGSRSALTQPLADRRVIRAVSADLCEVAALLRGDPAVQGVAVVEWLLTSPATPLHASEVEPLREQPGRARYLVTPG
jgi:hypothetical protein